MTEDVETQGQAEPLSTVAKGDPKAEFLAKLEKHLALVYPDLDRATIANRIVDVCDKYRSSEDLTGQPPWDENDVVLICYGDQVQDGARPTLQVMSQFLRSLELESLINTVHLLPINPYTSDDGFSVVDYRQIDQPLGTWDDVDALNEHFGLMLDLVLNHCSQHSDWFKGFLDRKSPYTDYFIEASPDEDLSQVVRPRSLPLLSEKQTADGPRFVWTTFSADQVDLNFACPDVMIEILDILLLYARHGARIVRLDAIAYLWKQIGTNCIHLPETHEVVKLMRAALEYAAPRTLIMTETNVPHAENISYFGDSDEAQMVYQFSLPPLLLDGYLQEDATTITKWLKTVCQSPPGTTYFNFTASHDGIGVRPLEGIVPPANLDRLAERALAIGGKVGTKSNADGSTSPYELNVTFLDMLLIEADTQSPNVDRFIASQAIALSLKGIPGIYFHSLFGTQNDIQAVEESGIPRRINRKKFNVDDLQLRIGDRNSVPHRVFEKYQQLLKIRKEQLAFHPDAQQTVVDVPNPQLLVFQRFHEPTGEQVTVVANFSGTGQVIARDVLPVKDFKAELISGQAIAGASVVVPPHDVLWLQ